MICAALAGVQDATDVQTLLRTELPSHADLVQGQLENGLKYVVLPNKTPPERFEAHLEVHAGSVDERVDEQGVAHLVEHVTFLGSRRREGLLGTGARANAYTDFHHTVFHVHAPVTNATNGQPMLPQVLQALEDIAFHPQFDPMRIEKERKAVLAEAQMMNTIEYRVDCQLLQYLHWENNLGCRFPIGLTDQIKQWPHKTLQDFWRRWYFPANTTLYLVGDMDRGVDEVVELIQKTFGHLKPSLESEATTTSLPGNGSLAASPADSHEHKGANGNGASTSLMTIEEVDSSAEQALQEGKRRERHAVRPPVDHVFGCGPLAPDFNPAPVTIFRHPLLQQFMLSVYCKLPIKSMTDLEGLRRMVIIRLILSAFQFRINKRYVESESPFVAIEMDISDSGREGCAVGTLAVTSEPRDWRGAVKEAVTEVKRLQRFGLTPTELDRYKKAMLMDSAQMAEQKDSITHIDSLDFVMESLALGHTIMSHEESDAAVQMVMDSITLEEVNAFARSYLTFGSDYGREREALAEVFKEGDQWVDPGPTRATAIIACLPSYMDASGLGTGGAHAGPKNKINMGAAGHLDADTIDLAELEAMSQAVDEIEIPEGAVPFEISAEDIAAALSDTSMTVAPVADVHVPRYLVAPSEVAQMMEEVKPRYIPPSVPHSSATDMHPPVHEPSGVTVRRLSNGIRLNYRPTKNEPKAGFIRVTGKGGRMLEPLEAGPQGAGCVAVGIRTLAESGGLGPWSREEVEVYCLSNLVSGNMDADAEYVIMDFHYSMGSEGLSSAMQVVHLILKDPHWQASALDRAKKMFVSQARSLEKSLERATSDRILGAMMDPDRRFRDPTVEQVEALTLEGCRAVLMDQLRPENIEVSISGDFEPAELEDMCLKYLGTVPSRPVLSLAPEIPIALHPATPETGHQTWHLRDSDERACAYILGPGPARWGPFGYFGPLEVPEEPVLPPVVVPYSASLAEKQAATTQRRQHPLHSSATLMLMSEIINSRLFTTVRDALGLTYDVSFTITMHDRIRTGWYNVNVTSYPDKIHEALEASLNVLRQVRTNPVTQRELTRAKRTVLTRHESDLKDNLYCLGLMTHLQREEVPYKMLDCLRDQVAMFEAITVDDIYQAYSQLQLDDEHVFTYIGTSGKAAPSLPPSPPPESAYQATATPITDPTAIFTAWMAAAQGVNLAKALQQLQQPTNDQPTE